MPLKWLDPAAQKLFEKAGLGDCLKLLSYEGGRIVSTARTRTCRRIVLGESAFFLKTQDLRKHPLPPRKWPSYLRHGSPILREAQSFPLLQNLGWGTPILAAQGRIGRLPWPRACLLLTREVEGHVDLAHFSGPPQLARAWARALHDHIGDTHAQGFILGGVRFRNFLVPEKGKAASPESLIILDQPRLHRSRSKRGRQKDLRYLDSDLERLLLKLGEREPQA
jgi:hypothetical protein